MDLCCKLSNYSSYRSRVRGSLMPSICTANTIFLLNRAQRSLSLSLAIALAMARQAECPASQCAAKNALAASRNEHTETVQRRVLLAAAIQHTLQVKQTKPLLPRRCLIYPPKGAVPPPSVQHAHPPRCDARRLRTQRCHACPGHHPRLHAQPRVRRQHRRPRRCRCCRRSTHALLRPNHQSSDAVHKWGMARRGARPRGVAATRG